MKGKYILIGSLILVCGLIVYQLTMNKKELDNKKNASTVVEVSIPVKAVQVKDTLLKSNILKNGIIIPFKETKALSIVSGTLKSIHFELGDHVKKGQLLAVIDDHTQQLNLQKAERNSAKLKSDLDTYSELFEGNATTKEKVNELRANYQDAVTQIGIIKNNISDTYIKSPSTGIISEKAVEDGMFVNSGSMIATIVDLTKTKAEVFLSENEVYQIKKDQIVEITTDVLPNIVFKGRVNFISPQADGTHNYKTEILVDNQSYTLLRSGTYIKVNFLDIKSENTLLIPREALIASTKEPVVFVVDGEKVKKRSIQTGVEMRGFIQVLDGLKAEERVVVSGQINLKDGSLVKVSQ